MKQKRILIITRNFPPLVGGMERLLWNIFDKIGQDYTCDVIGPKGSAKYIQPPHRAIECNIKPISFFLVNAFIKAVISCRKNRYDLCFAGSGVTAPIAVFIAKFFAIPSLVYIHGLDLVAENFIYQRFFVPFLRHATTVIANSHNSARLASAKGISQENIEILFPGVNIPEAKPEPSRDFFKKFALEGKKILLSVGRLVPRKGVLEFIQNALPGIFSCCPDAVYVIIGSGAENALKKEVSITHQIHTAIKEMGAENKIQMLGRVDDAVLTSAFQSAELLVFPLVKTPGDVEGFGMVAVEAAASGLPTVGFLEGGLPDAVDQGVSGILVESGNYEVLAKEIIKYLRGETVKIPRSSCIAHADKFNWDRFGTELLRICTATLNKHKSQR
jgi:phosphatidylinositol alpha-1,6-mannosyltransferase